MKILSILCMMFLAGATRLFAESAAATPEQLFRQGLDEYADGRYQQGAELFAQAIKELPKPPPFDPALLHYNLGIGRYRTGQPEEAAASFRAALKSSDLALQSRAYFNLGNSLYQTGKQKLDAGDIAASFMAYQDAQTNYVQAMRLDAKDMDAKVNYELTLLEMRRILQAVAMAIGRLQQGEQMVDEYRFIDAAQWFQQNLPVMEKALELEPDKKKIFEQMTERTGKVAEILAPAPPATLPGGTP